MKFDVNGNKLDMRKARRSFRACAKALRKNYAKCYGGADRLSDTDDIHVKFIRIAHKYGVCL